MSNIRKILTIFSLIYSFQAYAQDICMTAPVGFGRNATGGEGGAVVTVNSVATLKTALTSSGKKIIVVTEDINFGANDFINNKITDKTLLGLPGVKLIQLGDNGILGLSGGSNNVIIRNLIFEGPSAWDCDGRDLIQNTGCTNLWVDHCEFYDGMDGNFDNTNTADNITISWCKFGYKKPYRYLNMTGDGSGDHRLTNLIGGSGTAKPADDHYSITFMFCYWGDGCIDRMPRARNAELHILNCYYNVTTKELHETGGSGAEKNATGINLTGGSIGTTCYIEGCHFKKIGTMAKAGAESGNTASMKLEDCIPVSGKSLPANVGTATVKPTYPYNAIPASEVETAVLGLGGAGATLIVTPDGLVSAPEPTPAFPGAEGYGRYTTGGRGGAVYYVTTLEDNSNPGSLRYAVTRTGARTVLFKVSGTIFLNSNLNITNPNITIAGQSAPGDGICIAGYPVNVNADNVIMRYVRCRMGNEREISADGADALGGRFRKNVIIDHCSVSWSTDECCSFYQNTDFTLQWCLISESLNFGGHTKGEHGYGGIWGGFGASFHHNLLAHHKSRTPRLGPGDNTTPFNELCDIRNNVYYNYKGEGCYGGEAMHCNIVNNYYKPGPAGASLSSTKKGRIIAIDMKIDNSMPKIQDVWGDFFIEGNYVDGVANSTADNWTYGVYNQFASKYGTISQTTKDTLRLNAPLETGKVTTHSAQVAYEQVLQYAGCSLYRDAIDTRIIEEARTNTATYRGAVANLPGIIDSQSDLRPVDAPAEWSAWVALNQGEAPIDSDNDGIPDGWLDTNYPGRISTDKNVEGYTLLEVYLNGLVAEITDNQNNGSLTAIDEICSKGRTALIFDRRQKILRSRGDSGAFRVAVYSLTGSKVYSAATSGEIRLSFLPAGIYIVRAFFDDGTPAISQKIIV
jgi:pectate lyase